MDRHAVVARRHGGDVARGPKRDDQGVVVVRLDDPVYATVLALLDPSESRFHRHGGGAFASGENVGALVPKDGLDAVSGGLTLRGHPVGCLWAGVHDFEPPAAL